MDKTINYPSIWDSKPKANEANQKADYQQTFIDKAFIENFFDNV